MSIETFAAWCQILGVFGALATLAFVGFEIRDNSRAVRAATAQAVHDNYANWYLVLSGNGAPWRHPLRDWSTCTA